MSTASQFLSLKWRLADHVICRILFMRGRAILLSWQLRALHWQRPVDRISARLKARRGTPPERSTCCAFLLSRQPAAAAPAALPQN
jgi:hypothetical protein